MDYFAAAFTKLDSKGSALQPLPLYLVRKLTPLCREIKSKIKIKNSKSHCFSFRFDHASKACVTWRKASGGTPLAFSSPTRSLR